MTAASESPAATKARFLAELASGGIVLPPDQADMAATEFLLLDRHIRVIRTALAADATLPLGFAPLPATT